MHEGFCTRSSYTFFYPSFTSCLAPLIFLSSWALVGFVVSQHRNPPCNWGNLTGTGLWGDAYWWARSVCFSGEALQEKIISALICGASGIRVFLGNITAAASQCLKVLGRAAILLPRLVANRVCEHLDLLWISLGQEMHRRCTDLWTRRSLAGTFTQCGGRGLGVTPTTHPKWLTGKLK